MTRLSKLGALILPALLTLSCEEGLMEPRIAESGPAAAAKATAGGRILVTSDRAGAGTTDVYVMNADGSALTNLTNHPAVDRYPAWSRNGKRIAFVSNRDGNPEIYVMNADGTGLTRLTNDPASDLAPVWSNSGKQIAFTTARDGNFEVYVMNADGTGLTNLTRHLGPDTEPDW